MSELGKKTDPVTPTDRMSRTFYARIGKRAFDLCVGIVILCLIWPILLVLWVIVRRSMGTPVMLQQQRPGYKGRSFRIMKFRTMTNERDAGGRLLPDEQRITSVGNFLRSFSLDELSEIFNVLRGDMSLVGPRPLMTQYLDRYTPEQARRHDVLPGITGWAQINGRNNLTWEEKFDLDVSYVDHQSFFLDMQILAKTAWKVLGREGISQEGYVAAEEFMGSAPRPAPGADAQDGQTKPQASDRWEQGSEFHLMGDAGRTVGEGSPWDHNGRLFGSGRDAIRALLRMGVASHGWKRLFVPAYFCQDVIEVMPPEQIDVHIYDSWYPGRSSARMPLTCVEGDVVFIVNHFGLHVADEDPIDVSHASAIIEDHSHDPWSSWARASQADYCVASLRKTLPVPDGGVVWSPKDLELPPAALLTAAHRAAAQQKLEAMTLKARYLGGQLTDKSAYRALAQAGEETLCDKEISGISTWTEQHLNRFPFHEWRELRKRNYAVLRSRLSSVKGLCVLSPPPETDTAPFSCVVLFESEADRNAVRARLIEARIYPAVLWPLAKPVLHGIPTDHLEASRRMLSIHCDMRYSTEDMSCVAASIERTLPESRS